MSGRQSRTTRSAADFFRRNPVCHRHRGAHGRLDWSRAPAAGPPVGLLPARLYWTAYVRLKLSPALLGRKVCVILFGGGVAGHHPTRRHTLRPSASAGGG